MSLLNDLFDGVASDIMSAVSDRWSTNAANRAIENCCQQLRLSVHSRSNDGRICLQFEDPIVQARAVMVSIVDRGAYVSFMAMSSVTIPAKEIPAPVLGYMLGAMSDLSLLGMWRLAMTDRPCSRSTTGCLHRVFIRRFSRYCAKF